LGRYADAGIRNVLALRGDPPGGPGQPFQPHPDGFDYAAQLVEFVAGLGGFSVGVAAFPDVHPEAADANADAENLCRKAEAGASFAITQFFFEAAAYFRLVDRVRSLGCDLPIIPGLMPVTNVAQIDRFAQLSGTPVPGELATRFHEIADDVDAVRELGVEVAADLGARLLAGGAPGLHFYTLNRSTATREVARALGLTTTA
jgi:methylenetetrahydrofolate reductase (NADPH)